MGLPRAFARRNRQTSWQTGQTTHPGEQLSHPAERTTTGAWSPVVQNGQADKAAVPNHALTTRMREKGFSEARLATAASVDVKTVGRWVRGESLPQAVNARATADALGCDPQVLWADMFPTMQPPGIGTVAVSMYGSRTKVPVHVWEAHFAGAIQKIESSSTPRRFCLTPSTDSHAY